MYVSSQSPYYDDFNENKQFYRILFRPGRSVQARELTQLQSILQKQFERFGSHIFKEGSVVIPGSPVYEGYYEYVKLQSTYNSIDADNVIDDLLNLKIIGGTTGVKAKVVSVSLTDGDDPPTLFVKYLSSGTDGITRRFSDNEILTDIDDFDNLGTNVVRAAITNATGQGTAFSITSGVIFIKGTFAYFPSSTLVVSKYSRTTSDKRIGFLITEEIIDDQDDSSLLDPAVGSSNYFAPGADRYKIGFTLEARGIGFDTVVDDPNFIELMRIQDNLITFIKPTVEYNLLEDTLARRTYDESGDYVVDQYRLDIINHLKTDNTKRDGYITASEGGNDDKYVVILSPGKSYVKGYEVKNLVNSYIIGDKARNNVSVNGGIVATEFGNYIYITDVYSMPDLSSMVTLELYNKYTTARGTKASGATLVGNAKIRALEYFSNTVGTSTSIYKAYLFDVEMVDGYTFEEDVKQLFYDNSTFVDFTANIVPTYVSLSGTVSTTNGTNVITGSGTVFQSELEIGDFITIGDKLYNIDKISNTISLNSITAATVTVSGLNPLLNEVRIVDNNKQSFIFKLPYNIIKTVDPNSQDTDYTVRRIYDRTLSGGTVTIVAGTGETFTSYDTEKYQLMVKNDGSYVNLSGKVTRGGTPTGRTVTFDLSANASLSSADVRIISTVRKQDTAALKKIKTLNENVTIDYTSNVTATSSVISLQKSDIFRLKSVFQSISAFETSFSSSGAIDVTDRYTLDNGQRLAFYDVGSIILKPGYPKPLGPIRITFDYFSHSSGDYFSVDSYVDIDYKNIPSVTLNGTIYNLRDCIDFRPRISDSGVDFSATGSSTTEFLDPEIDFQVDYEYYIPKTDKLVVDRKGNVSIISGISDTMPIEPKTPSDSMALYILKQNAYVFNVESDINIIEVDNRRYTMRDIGRIENRVKNLEYFTTLNLLENQTAALQIRDAGGIDRFKNGFIVDNFSGHGIGDVKNPEYKISVDTNKRELRPLFEQNFVRLFELGSTSAGRTSNNYTLSGQLFLPKYTDELFITSNNATRSETINPFNVADFRGVIVLTPDSDTWFETQALPLLTENNNGTYDTLTPYAETVIKYDSIKGNHKDFWYGNERTEERVNDSDTTKSSVIKTSDLITNQSGNRYEIVETFDFSGQGNKVISRVVIPKMRNIDIKFSATGLKPNTKHYAFFDDLDVTSYTTLSYNRANAIVQSGSYAVANAMVYLDLTTDQEGSIEGIFNYYSSDLNLLTGPKYFRLTDSKINSDNRSSVADAVFNSSGNLKKPTPPVIPSLPRNETRSNDNVTSPTTSNPVDEPEVRTLSNLIVTNINSNASVGSVQYLGASLSKAGITDATAASVNQTGLGPPASPAATNFTGGNFNLNKFAQDVNDNDYASISAPVKQVYEATKSTVETVIVNNLASITRGVDKFNEIFNQNLATLGASGAAEVARSVSVNQFGYDPTLASIHSTIVGNPTGAYSTTIQNIVAGGATAADKTSLLISSVAATVAAQGVLGAIASGGSTKVGP